MSGDTGFSINENSFENLRKLFKATFVEDLGVDASASNSLYSKFSSESAPKQLELQLTDNIWPGHDSIKLTLEDLINLSFGGCLKYPGLKGEQQLAIFENILDNNTNVEMLIDFTGNNASDKHSIYKDMLQAWKLCTDIIDQERKGKLQMREQLRAPQLSAYAGQSEEEMANQATELEAKRVTDSQQYVIARFGDNFADDLILKELTKATTSAVREEEAPKALTKGSGFPSLRGMLSFRGKIPVNEPPIRVEENITTSLRAQVEQRVGEGAVDKFTSEMAVLFSLDPGLFMSMRDEGTLSLNWKTPSDLQVKIEEIKASGRLSSRPLTGETDLSVGEKTLLCLERLLVAKNNIEVGLTAILGELPVLSKAERRRLPADQMLLAEAKIKFERGKPKNMADNPGIPMVELLGEEEKRTVRRTSMQYLEMPPRVDRRTSVTPPDAGLHNRLS